jgi:uncharacterized protein
MTTTTKTPDPSGSLRSPLDRGLRPLALVTGASGGIGAEIAKVLAAQGHDLVLVARSEPGLRTVADAARTSGASSTVITADLAQPGAGHRLAQELKDRGLHIDVLVNNAGFADFGEMWKADAEKLDQMITLNISTLTELMRDLLPDMVAKRSGRVMNLASTAAFFPGPLMAVYYATKGYVLSLSEGVNEELKGTGVTVTAVCPGPTESGFQAKAEMEASKLVNGRKIPSAQSVAEAAVKATMAGKPVAVIGSKNKLNVLSPRFLPRRLIPGIVKKAQAAAH